MIDPAVQAAAVASTIAAGATVSGYLLNQSRTRRERRATAFAEALTVLRRYQDYPYKIWRRTGDDPDTRAALADEQNATGMATSFQHSWLQVDAPVVGEAYRALLDVARRERQASYETAWQSPPIRDAKGMAARPPFQRRGSDPELKLCILAMRNEMSLLAPLRRRRIRRLIREQVERRTVTPP